MKITGVLAHACNHGDNCPQIRDTDGDDVIIQGDRLELREPALHLSLGLPQTEGALLFPRRLLGGPRLTLAEMSDWIRRRHHTHFLRIQNRHAYGAASDNRDLVRFHAGEAAPVEGAAWRDKLRSDTAEGKIRAKVHIVEGGMVSPYEQYSLQWAFPGNAEAGEQLRVLDAQVGALAGVPDFAVIDHEHVIRMHYADADDELEYATPITGPDAATYRALASMLWAQAEDATTWWNERPHLHRAST